MLLYFKVANYQSISDEITLSFKPTVINEHSESNVIIDDNGPAALKSLLLYGHNASGKSKILTALVFMRYFVTTSATDSQSNKEINVEPFEFLESTIEKPSSFEVLFVIGKNRYRYGFETNKNVVVKEWLLETKSLKEYPVFLRLGQEFEINSKRFKDARDLEKRTRKNALFLSVCSQWNVSKAQKIEEWFGNIITIHGLTDSSYRKHTLDLLKDKKYEPLINKFIKMADLGINDINVLNVPLGDIISQIPDDYKETFKKKYEEQFETTVFTVHNRYNDKNEIVGQVSLSLDSSGSEGTKKYFNMIGLLIHALYENRIVIIDEFDARLHTLLSKAILKLFNSSKIRSKAQLLVASHDTALLDRDLLRRDQIYFVEKNRIGATTLTSLVEYKPRKETPFYKNYLEGKYGGIPFIEDLESLFPNE